MSIVEKIENNLIMRSLVSEMLAEFKLKKDGMLSLYQIIKMITVIMEARNELIERRVAIPLKDYQGIDRGFSRIEDRISTFRSRVARGENVTKEDVKAFLKAVKELDDAVKEMEKRGYAPDSEEGKNLAMFKKNVEMIKNEKLTYRVPGRIIDAGKIGDYIDDPDKIPEVLKLIFTQWGDRANKPDGKAEGPLIEWEEKGLRIMRSELDLIIDGKTSETQRELNIFNSIRSAAQKKIELGSQGQSTMVQNQISR